MLALAGAILWSSVGIVGCDAEYDRIADGFDLAQINASKPNILYEEHMLIFGAVAVGAYAHSKGHIAIRSYPIVMSTPRLPRGLDVDRPRYCIIDTEAYRRDPRQDESNGIRWFANEAAMRAELARRGVDRNLPLEVVIEPQSLRAPISRPR